MLIKIGTLSLGVMAFMAVPASAEFVTFGNESFNWFAQSPYFHAITFDTLTPDSYGSSLSGIPLETATFYGFTGLISWSQAWLYVETEGTQWSTYNYGGTGNVLTTTHLAGEAGFRIVLPNPVTYFGVQIMGPDAGRKVTVNAGTQTANQVYNPLVGTVTTLDKPGRTFFGFSSSTPFTTIDITGASTTGVPLVIDNIYYGDTPEPQTVVYLLTGLGAMLLGRKRAA